MQFLLDPETGQEFRVLDPEEEASLRDWARKNSKPADGVSVSQMHPVVRDEWKKSAAAIESMPIVWVLHLHYEDNDHYFAFDAEDAAKNFLQEHVKEEWDNHYEDESRPEDDEIVEKYYNRRCDCDEWWGLASAKVRK